MQYKISHWNTLNDGIGYGFVVQYPTGDTYQQINNSERKLEAIKYEFNTMVEVKNQLKKHIDLTVEDKYLKGANKLTLGFGNGTTLAVLQYIYNMCLWCNLWYEYCNNERMIKAYESTTTIDWLFVHIY